jgi:FixJ family two-component response regulator
MPAAQPMLLLESFIAVVDDDISMREALSSLLRSVGLQVQTFTSAQEFLHSPQRDLAGCLVLDVRLPGLSGLELQGYLIDDGVHIPIVFITAHADIPMTVHAMKAGAVEFLAKPFREQDLLDAVQEGLRRDREQRRSRQQLRDARDRFDVLTVREREVMALIVSGKLNKQVASELGLSEITVKMHRRHVMEKMGVKSFADLVRLSEKLL